MTPQRYIADRKAEGAKLTHIVGELAAITGACERTVWRWVKGECTPTNSALRLIQLWYSSNEQFTPQTRGDFFAKKARQAAVYWL